MTFLKITIFFRLAEVPPAGYLIFSAAEKARRSWQTKQPLFPSFELPDVKERAVGKGHVEGSRARWPLVIERDFVQLYLMAAFSTVMAKDAARLRHVRHDFQQERGTGGCLDERWERKERSKGCSKKAKRVKQPEMKIYLGLVGIRFNRGTAM